MTSAFILSRRTLAVWVFKTSFAIRARKKDTSPPVASPGLVSVPASCKVSATAFKAAWGTGVVAAAASVDQQRGAITALEDEMVLDRLR